MNATELDPIQKISKDVKAAVSKMSVKEARYLVDFYYQIQEYRKAASNQFTALEKAAEPNEFIKWFLDQNVIFETQIKRALDAWGSVGPLGQWAKSVVGIGPVITAGLLAHIDITKAPTVGHIWRFAGLDPTVKWEKGKKRPWNASLKLVCWKAGQSFIKTSNLESDFYGHLWRERWAIENAHNDAGELAEQAKYILATKKIKKDTEAYKAYIQGKLPPAHILARAQRWTVKLFLAHYHEVAYQIHYNAKPPRPYVLEHIPGHAHKIEVPNWPMAGAIATESTRISERTNTAESAMVNE